MKYRLCLRKAPSYIKNTEYLEIKGFLPEPNCYDLKDICNFTMKFNDSNALREYLLSNGLIDKKASNFGIVITYEYCGTKELRIPLKEDERFFVMSKLINIITKEVEANPAFMEYFLLRAHMPSIISELRYNSEYIDVYDKVVRFINIMCRSKGKFRFRAFYDIAITVADVYRQRKSAKAAKAKPEPQSVPLTSFTPLTETQETHLEELLDRQRKLQENRGESQLSLF